MQANPRTIDALFNSQCRYVVPMFQRLYVWGENPQWSTLWEDIVEKAELRLAGKKSNPHYLGALIVEGVKPSSAREVTRLLVIDGQQRLTTLQLLLCAFRDFARSEAWNSLERKANRYIENPDADVMEKPDEEIFKIWPTVLNREVFSDLITAGSRQAVEAKYPLTKLKYKRKPEPRSPLVEAYLYFYSRIGAWVSAAPAETEGGREGRGFSLMQAIQQDFCVVEIALSEGDDSQEIFYSLNSQGRPLSQSDLLRSLIFMRAEKEQEDRDALFADFWGAFETAYWSSEVKRAGRTYTRLDLALRHFLTVKTGELVDARRVNEDYRRWIASDPAPYPSVRAELTDFTRYTTAFQNLDGSFSAARSDEIGRVLQDFEVSTAIPLVLYLHLEAGLSPADLKTSINTVQSFIIRRAFIGEENREYNKLFVEVAASLRGVDASGVPAALAAKLLSGGGSTRSWPTDEQLMEAAVTDAVYGRLKPPALRIILERIELSLRGKKTEDDAVQAGLQVEHVMPRSWSANWPLQGQTVQNLHMHYPYLIATEEPKLSEAIRTRNIAVNSIGNLTLLNEYLNPAASNGDFGLKCEEYRHSVLRLNRHFDGRTAWDEVAIRARGKMLGETMCKLWPRPKALVLGDSTQGLA